MVGECQGRKRNGKAHKIGCEIITCIVKAVIHEGRNDAFSGVSHLPYRGRIHHVLGKLVIDVVPLFFEEGILDAKTFCNSTGGFRNLRFYWRRGTLNSPAKLLFGQMPDGGNYPVRMVCIRGTF